MSSPPANGAPLRIDVFSDIVCPWCYIGTARLDHVIASLDLPTPPVVIRHPFLLQPDTPTEGKDVHADLRRKYGTDPRVLFARVEAAARESGLALDLAKQPMTYPTVRAHTLLRHAATRGTQRALEKALFEAYFHDARNISDPDVLAAVAAPHGFDPTEVTRLLQDEAEIAATFAEIGEASALGITGVPFFVFNGRLAVAGAQRETVLRQAVDQAIAQGPADTEE